MCGFFISNVKIINDETKEKIRSSLKFRGPDYSSEFIEINGWSACHSRLSIIGLDENANQPFLDETGGMLVFNGEILNYKEIGLKYFGIEFFSDTVLLSSLIINYKLSIAELDGFFAFVYIDGLGKLKYAARDRFGVKPLYYFENKESISFSSEPAALKKICSGAINKDAIEEYRCLRAPVFEPSYFTDINQVAPGVCHVNGTYFQLESLFRTDYGVTVDEVKDAINNGIKSRKISDAKVGLLLSRGIDSNLIAKLGRFDKMYSIGFEGDEDIEFLKTQNIEGLSIFACNTYEYKEAFEYLLSIREEPLSVPNEVLLYLIGKKAKKDGVKVLLSGEGADEFFGGYDRIFTWAKVQDDKFELDDFIALYCYQKPLPGSKLYIKFKDFFEKIPMNSCFEKVRYFFIKCHSPILFRRLDFSLMAAGVEGREPLANLHVLSAALRSSPETLMSDGLGKITLREILIPYMGKEFSYASKVGFPVKLNKIFTHEEGKSNYEIWFDENVKVLNK